jgi:hypothetical protein
MRTRIILALLAGFLLSTAASESAYARKSTYGDEDPIPWACVSFEGQWKADNGRPINIVQKDCSWLKITSGPGYSDQAPVVIVPDDKVRSFKANECSGSARYRWNSQKVGTVLETYRQYETLNRHVEEFVTLEQVNNDLLLESTYRVIRFTGVDRPRTETKQVVLRRRNPK